MSFKEQPPLEAPNGVARGLAVAMFAVGVAMSEAGPMRGQTPEPPRAVGIAPKSSENGGVTEITSEYVMQRLGIGATNETQMQKLTAQAQRLADQINATPAKARPPVENFSLFGDSLSPDSGDQIIVPGAVRPNGKPGEIDIFIPKGFNMGDGEVDFSNKNPRTWFRVPVEQGMDFGNVTVKGKPIETLRKTTTLVEGGQEPYQTVSEWFNGATGKWIKAERQANLVPLSAEAADAKAQFPQVVDAFPEAVYNSELGFFSVGKTEFGQDIVLIPGLGEPQSQPSYAGYEKGKNSKDGLYGLRAEIKSKTPEDYQAIVVGTIADAQGTSITVFSDKEGPFTHLKFSDTEYWSAYVGHLVEKEVMPPGQHINVVFGGQDMAVTVLSGIRNPDVTSVHWIKLFDMDEQEAPYYQVGVFPGIAYLQEQGVRWFYTNPDKETIIIRPPWVAAALSYSLINKLEFNDRLTLGLEYLVWDGVLHGAAAKNRQYMSKILETRDSMYKALGGSKNLLEFGVDFSHPQVVAANKIYADR